MTYGPAYQRLIDEGVPFTEENLGRYFKAVQEDADAGSAPVSTPPLPEPFSAAGEAERIRAEQNAARQHREDLLLILNTREPGHDELYAELPTEKLEALITPEQPETVQDSIDYLRNQKREEEFKYPVRRDTSELVADREAYLNRNKESK